MLYDWLPMIITFMPVTKCPSVAESRNSKAYVMHKFN